MENNTEENYNGIAEDPRTDEQKAQDYNHADVYGSEVVWQKKEIKDLKNYTDRYQSTSLSCCGQGSAKGVETLVGKVMSAHPPYRSRSNFSQGGMFTADIGAVWKNVGSNLEEVDQSQNQGEQLLNRDITCTTPYKIGGYIFPNSKKIDEIAKAIETYNHCIVIFHANSGEWKGKPVYNGMGINFGHCVCAVDYFLDENGIKCLYIEDSAALASSLDDRGHRIITEDYLKERCSSAIYFTSVNPLEVPYVFTKTLRYGSRGFDVKKLQAKLEIKVDGIFGHQTENVVKKFQMKNNLVADGIVGKLTNNYLNK